MSSIQPFTQLRIDIYRYVTPTFSAIFITFNILNFIVYSRKTFKNKPIAFYSRVINVLDSISALLMIRRVFSSGFNIGIDQLNPILCALGSYSVGSISVMSSLLLCMISFDRMMSILYPNRFNILKKKSFQVFITIFIILSQLAFYSVYPIFNKWYRPTATQWQNRTIFINESIPNSNQTNLTISFEAVLVTITIDIIVCGNQAMDRTIRLMDSINASIWPFSLMITFTLITLGKIFISRMNSASRSQTSNVKSKIKNIKRKDLNFAIVSISMNLVFLILYTPVCVFQLLNIPRWLFDLTNAIIAQHLYYLNFGSMFFINMAVNQIFRREFYLMLHLSLPKNKIWARPFTTNSSI
jgi:hypothetical protein